MGNAVEIPYEITRCHMYVTSSFSLSTFYFSPMATLAKYQRFLVKQAPRIETVESWLRSLSLVIPVSYCEVVAEMWIKKNYSEKTRWRFVVWMETIKYQMLNITGGRMLLHPSHPQRDVDPATLELDEDSSDFDPRTGGVHYHSNEEEDQWGHPEHLVYRLHGLGKLGEIAWIARPLLYVVAVRKYGFQSWKAWLLSLSVDLLSRGMLGNHYAHRKEGSMTALEADEYGRRAFLLLYYLLRGPFYQHFTKPKLEAFCDATETRPVASIIAGVIRDYQPLWEDVYFYTAGS
ncbi:hypothetical protein NQZ79_g6289 [Umbelopsis isabellina]|nr:hypothetical protein NQZ79_g6289 [Umbelopsis isabellina]